jgi:hypothetical protein
LRALHYVCDSFLFDTYQTKARIAELNSTCFSVDESYNTVLRGNLASSRFVDTHRLIESIVAWQPNVHEQTIRSCATASHLIGARVGSKLTDLTAEEFAEVCRRLTRQTTVVSKVIPSLGGAGAPVTTSPPLPVPTEAGSGASHVVAGISEKRHGQETRKIVLIREYPQGGTLQGLLDLGSVGGEVPVGGAIFDNDQDTNSAILWYSDENAPFRVAERLAKKRWAAEAAILAEESAAQGVAAVTGHGESGTTEPMTPEALRAEAEQWVLVVSAIPKEFPLNRIKAALKEVYPSAHFISKHWRSRSSTKYEARFKWPKAQPVPQEDVLTNSLSVGEVQLECAFELIR